MKVGVISDTHDQGELIREAVEVFNLHNVSHVIHCGDWVSPFILHFFQGLKCPLRGVFGNNDGDKFRHLIYKSKGQLDVDYEDRFLELTIDERLISVFHGDYAGIVDALITCGKYDAVFHGHTHQRINQRVGKTLSLNPGSLMRETSHNINGASVAIYDTRSNEAIHHLFL